MVIPSSSLIRLPRCGAPARRVLAFAVVFAAAAIAACAPVARPAPEPAPEPSPEEIRDSLRRADSIARAAAERARLDSIARADSLARAALERARLDSIARIREARLRVCGGGDVLLSTNLDTTWATRRGVAPFPSPDALLAPLRPLVEDADVILFNIEGAIGEGPAPRKCRPGSTSCYAFRQPPAAADALARFAGDRRMVGNVANNHARDAGEAGLVQTTRHLERAGVHVTGFDTLATVVTAANGETVAILGFSTSPGALDARDLAAVRRHVERAAAEHERVVVTMHMGAEGARAQRTPDSTEIFLGTIDRGNLVAFARTVTEAGADLVIGHGPHVMRAMEWRGDALVIYSLGNLLTYGPFTMSEPLNRGGIACATLDGEGSVVEAVLHSTVQTPPGIARPDPTHRAAALVDSLGRLDFPLTGARLGERGEIRKIPIP